MKCGGGGYATDMEIEGGTGEIGRDHGAGREVGGSSACGGLAF